MKFIGILPVAFNSKGRVSFAHRKGSNRSAFWRRL